MSPNQHPRKVTSARKLLRCDGCGHSVEYTNAELLAHTRSGWPRCCGAIMIYFVEADPPTGAQADDTQLDRPSLPPS
jgi:hypothetical protein